LDPNEIDTEPERKNFIKLKQPFYRAESPGYVDIERTASFGEAQDLLAVMPSFAKIGFLSSGLKNKANQISKKEELKQTKSQTCDEIGPEYMNIDPNKNLHSGFFYLAKHAEKEEYAKTSPRKRTIIFDLAGVLVAFADPKSGGISSAQ
jgi:hypothetical protein